MAFKRLDKRNQKIITDKFNDMKSVLAPAYVSLLEKVVSEYKATKDKVKVIQAYFVDVVDEIGRQLQYPLQQLTDKTAVVLVNGECIQFDRYTGKCRNRLILKELNVSCISDFNENKTVISPNLSRDNFKKKYDGKFCY